MRLYCTLVKIQSKIRIPTWGRKHFVKLHKNISSKNLFELARPNITHHQKLFDNGGDLIFFWNILRVIYTSNMIFSIACWLFTVQQFFLNFFAWIFTIFFSWVHFLPVCIVLLAWKKVKLGHFARLTLQKLEVCAQLNDLEKRFKICHIFVIRKPT